MRVKNIDLEKMISPLVFLNLKTEERDYLQNIFARFNGFPNLEEVWKLLDEAWTDNNCDPNVMDERIDKFYRHPVWILNGLFIEQHQQSLENRYRFKQWVIQQAPRRVADFGGGFGGLARLIGEALPNVHVDVVDPHPHPAAIALAANTPNVRFVSELSGNYDILIATDVFEHVPDPLILVAETSKHLQIGGQYLIANCFAPVILCHLPQSFHFNISWGAIMKAMGLEPGETVLYARAYRRQGVIDYSAACLMAECGRNLYRWISKLPRGRGFVGRILMRLFYS